MMGHKGDIWAEWSELRAEIKDRLTAILRPSVLMYFVGVVLVVGALGAWTQLYREDYGGFFEGLGTYALAILTSATLELVLPSSDKTIRSLRIFGFTSLALGIALTIPTIHARELWEAGERVIAALPACALTIIAWVLWILVNSENSRLFADEAAESAIGGPSSSGLAGNLDNFKV